MFNPDPVCSDLVPRLLTLLAFSSSDSLSIEVLTVGAKSSPAGEAIGAGAGAGAGADTFGLPIHICFLLLFVNV
tara:strand:- start:6784 stop:7005 length:222 start_codon:yes stop_codon:yes gene_type:complete